MRAHFHAQPSSSIGAAGTATVPSDRRRGVRPKRLAFLAWRDLAHPQAGGSEILIDRLATGAAARGHDVTLLCGGPVDDRPYRVVDIGGTYSQYLRAPVSYLRHARDADLVIDVENGIPYFSPLWRRGPVVCLVHHVHRDQWRMRFNRGVAAAGWWMERSAMPRLYDSFLAVSPSTAIGLQEIGVPAQRIRVLPEGVDMPDRPAEPAGDPRFLVLGRLVPHKRVDLVLRAWERVRPRVGGTLVIIGDGPERESLEAQAGPGVEFLGKVSEAQKEHELRQAWLLVHGATHEGWGLVLMEAAAAGVPALAMDAPGVRDAVMHGRTGVLTETEDELVRQWIELAFHRERRTLLGHDARVRAARYTWTASVDVFLDLVGELTHTRRQ
ncbi:MAG: glycosyltransferase family 4 protein [Actinobacteria bacterium]|nr:glycosyltransferase family 4 protein [Actinomycetota bacterium]